VPPYGTPESAPPRRKCRGFTSHRSPAQSLDINLARAVAYGGGPVSVACHALHKCHAKFGAPFPAPPSTSCSMTMGKAGRVYRETAKEEATLESVIDDLFDGAIQQSGAHCRVQHVPRMVAGCLRGCRARGDEVCGRACPSTLLPVRVSSSKHSSTRTNYYVPKAA
jgi:hypothetical protein